MIKPRAAYNEIDPYAAAWLRNLISRGLIADGDVFDCSIADLRPNDLKGYNQFHAFAGIGIWSLGLRRAGIPDSANVWTGSCPCQPFSAAGKGGGFDDERHLWPAFHHLIRFGKPDVVLGEQVASKDGLAWLDLVQSDMEGTNYAFGAIDTCSAGFGAPHIRQRLRFAALANAKNERHARLNGKSRARASLEFKRPNFVDQLADAAQQRRGQVGANLGGSIEGTGAQRRSAGLAMCGGVDVGGLADASGGQFPQSLGRAQGRNGHGPDSPDDSDVLRMGDALRAGLERLAGDGDDGDQSRRFGADQAGHVAETSGIGHNSGVRLPGPVNGFWANADWLYCRDGKWRPVESGTFPLAHGDPSRVGRLRAFGNAVDAEATTEFCRAVKEAAGL